MTKAQFEIKLAKVKERNEGIAYRKQLRKERWKYFPRPRFPSTSKLILIFAALISIEVVAFCQYVILTTGDTSALYSMIGTVGTFMPIVIAYYNKAKAENTVGGITFESMLTELEGTQTDAVG